MARKRQHWLEKALAVPDLRDGQGARFKGLDANGKPIWEVYEMYDPDGNFRADWVVGKKPEEG